jgi:hypothetical protein
VAELDFKQAIVSVLDKANLLAVLAGSALVIVDRFSPETRAAFGNLPVAMAVSLILLNALRFFYLRRPRQETLFLLSHGREGQVRIAREAIESSLKVAGEQIREIGRVRVQVGLVAPRRVQIRAFFVLVEGTRIMDVSARLRGALRERFAEMVSLEPGSQVECVLEFEGFATRPSRKGEKGEEGKSQAPAKAFEPPPFTGPRYPIDDGDEVT